MILALLLLSAGGSLEAALDSVDPVAIHADVEFLAADAMRGRDTPSRGLRIAARYIRSRLERDGWSPAAPGGFFYHYWLDYMAVDDDASGIEATGPGGTAELEFGRDYFFHTGNMTNDVFSGGVVFMGTGSQEETAGIDASGRWALCWSSDLSWRRRQRNVEETGAIGILITPGPDYDGAPYPERYASWAEAAHAPRPTWPAGFRRPVWPTAYVTREAGAELLRVAGVEGVPSAGQELDLRVTDRRATRGPGGQIELENVAGLWPGKDPELRHEVIVLSAHYDHVGTHDGKIYNGADDNASGSSGLLAIADALARRGPLRRSVLLLWVSGEEKGLLGSKAWSLYPWLPEGYRPILDINIDMIGRNAPDSLLITPTPDHPAHNQLTSLAESLAGSEGFGELGSADAYWNRSDQAMFREHLGLPACFLFSDVHEDYHQPTDTADKIDADKIRRVVRLVLRMLEALQADRLELDSAPTALWHTARTRGDALALAKAAEAFAEVEGAPPASLAELLQPGPDGEPWLEGRQAVPRDAWQRPFLYEVDADGEPVVTSLGRDGRRGGEGEDADVSSEDRP